MSVGQRKERIPRRTEVCRELMFLVRIVSAAGNRGMFFVP